jgi:hypothetical protein
MADTSRARCGNDPRAQLTPGDRKAVDDFKARLALQAAVKPHLDSAVWVDGDPLMEVIAVTLWERCARDDEDMPQLVRRRWHREHGWVYEPDGIRDEAQRDATRYALAEAVPLARQLADETSDAETQDVPRRDPHPTEADVRHALRVRDFFEGRDTTPAADEA